MANKRFNFLIDEETIELFKRTTGAQGKTASEVLNDLIVKYLEDNHELIDAIGQRDN